MKSICFCGMDGSGKSTQSRILTKRLKDLGITIEKVHMLTQGNTVSSSLQSKPVLKGLRKKLRSLPCDGFMGKMKLFIGLIAFFIDAWVTYVQNWIRYRGTAVIYDRFFYDQIVMFAATFVQTPWWVIQLLKVLPKADIIIFMEVPPEVGQTRKPEESISVLKQYFIFYRLAAKVLGTEVIDGTKDREVISDYIYQRCAEMIQ